MGQFILTGSAVPDKEAEGEREHSGTGRFAWLTMRPMTLFESGESNGRVSLGDLFTAPEKILEKNCSNTDKVNRIIAIDHEKRNEEICDYVIRNNNYEEALSEIINVLGLEEKRD
jgi:hypothetical protein